MVDDRCQPQQSASPRFRSERRQSGDESHKRGVNTKIHLAVDAHGMPLRAIITAGTVADCKQASRLIEGLSKEFYKYRHLVENAFLHLKRWCGIATRYA